MKPYSKNLNMLQKSLLICNTFSQQKKDFNESFFCCVIIQIIRHLGVQNLFLHVFVLLYLKAHHCSDQIPSRMLLFIETQI